MGDRRFSDGFAGGRETGSRQLLDHVGQVLAEIGRACEERQEDATRAARQRISAAHRLKQLDRMRQAG